ncbi:MAG: TetR/AcrR family transcriptional regulator [Candidatus Obscuribacterales bacterium]|nr:TetR/AcrR family transcriptional regulator [Candidatus Obscuribacterales bacterium]
MSPKVATKQETKTALLEVGMEMMFEKGYTNTGIQEILNALSVPKGSFYHYFDSKENYAVEIIHHFDVTYAANLMRTLRNPQQTPLERLRTYCETSKATLAARECRRGCLIGNLSQEMADQSEVLRKELSKVMAKWRDMFAACIDEGQKSGEIKNNKSAQELAEFFSAAWSGAVMRAKTVQNTEPLDVCIDMIFGEILKA